MPVGHVPYDGACGDGCLNLKSEGISDRKHGISSVSGSFPVTVEAEILVENALKEHIHSF